MQISVVVPTHNRLARLQEVVAALEQQTFPRDDFEVIIVADGASDGTNAYLRALETPLQLRFVLQENQGAAVARNVGVAQASGALILFVDDDVVPSPQLVAEHVRAHAHARDGDVVVLGPMLTPPDFVMQPWVQWEQAMLEKQYDDMLAGHWAPTARQFYTGNSSLARRRLLASGGFDPAFRRAEDVELAYRLEANEAHFAFHAQAVGYHYAERSYASWFAIPYAYGRNDVIFTQEKGHAWLLPRIWREYHERHASVRRLTELCLDRPWRHLCYAAFKQVILHGRRVDRPQLADAACSAIFNLRYYQGVADELGGRDAFFAGVARYTAEGKQALPLPSPLERRGNNAS